MNRFKGFVILFFAVLAFLGIRKWLDRNREKVQDVEIIRSGLDEGDAHLGVWAQKNTDALVQLRLKRDGSFTYEVVSYPANDTIRYSGKHQIIPTTGYNGNPYPRLVAVSKQGDTVINHYVYLTHAVTKNVDMLGLANDNSPDAGAMMYYRIKQ